VCFNSGINAIELLLFLRFRTSRFRTLLGLLMSNSRSGLRVLHTLMVLSQIVLVLFFLFKFDLVLIANGRKEKFASGLLKPFLAHLKAVQDQIAIGGYSITLEPNSGFDVPWFTRGTVERLASRFLYYCSTVTPGIAYLPVGSFLCQLFADLCVS